MKRKTIIKLSITAIIIVLLAVMLFIGNNMIEVTTYKITSEKIPTEFQDFKIAQISDFHNKKNNEEILEKLKEASPDIIVITGDFIDSRKTKTQISLDFAKELIKIAPCYYVIGNHEARLTEVYPEFEQELIKIGVTVLRNQSVKLERNGEKITLIGIDDPRLLYKKDSTEKACQVIKDELSTINYNGYTVLLSHRPEAFKEYVSAEIDLALTGHAHGGQAILPFIGGIIAPNQGLFPKYYKGIHQENNTQMVVSRGLGNSLCPIRFNNRPEIVIVELASH
ncbi:MAG: metallophosphoesterase [Clostridia bacterium]|nr:metallophosphoesterase [Clostridia bacterium]